MFERETAEHSIKILRGRKGEIGASHSGIYYGMPLKIEETLQVAKLLFKMKADGPCPTCAGCAQDMDILDEDIKFLETIIEKKGKL